MILCLIFFFFNLISDFCPEEPAAEITVAGKYDTYLKCQKERTSEHAILQPQLP